MSALMLALTLRSRYEPTEWDGACVAPGVQGQVTPRPALNEYARRDTEPSRERPDLTQI